MSGSSRILTKLNDAIQTHKYYEAHQLLKTLNFRYTTAQKFDELEGLLVTSAGFLLDNKQDESGMDVAIMLANLYKIAEFQQSEKRVSDSISLLRKMPSSPERGQFIALVLDWIGISPLSGNLHSCAAQMYIQERGFDDAWRHVVRLYDGKEAAMLTMQIIQALGNMIRREELGLLTGHLVVTFLAAKKITQAEEAFLTMVQTQDIHHLTPLLNGIRYLIEAAKTNDGQAWKAVQTLYDLSFTRDPNLRKIVNSAGKSLFNFTSEDRSSSRGGGIMSFLNAFMNPDVSQQS